MKKRLIRIAFLMVIPAFYAGNQVLAASGNMSDVPAQSTVTTVGSSVSESVVGGLPGPDDEKPEDPVVQVNTQEEQAPPPPPPSSPPEDFHSPRG